MFRIRQSLINSLATFLDVKCLRTHPLKAQEEYIIGKVGDVCFLLYIPAIARDVQVLCGIGLLSAAEQKVWPILILLQQLVEDMVVASFPFPQHCNSASDCFIACLQIPHNVRQQVDEEYQAAITDVNSVYQDGSKQKEVRPVIRVSSKCVHHALHNKLLQQSLRGLAPSYFWDFNATLR